MPVRLFVRVVIAVFALFVIGCGAVSAQEATVTGTVLDQSKAVMPGATVTATNIDTGRQFVSATSDRGEYRLTGMPAGRYRVRAEMAGFATTVLPDLELLVGQNAEIPITLKVSTVEQTVTVTSETPLVDTSQAQVASNIDRRQMDQLPLWGRDWLELSMQVAGITANTVSVAPGVSSATEFRLNLDGQEVTQDRLGSFGQGGISRDAIAEYQVVTNNFDVTMGRSTGIQVQAISQGGTNNVHGSVYGYFRNDAFDAKDAFLNKVLPYSDQQIGGTVGGPIKKDKLFFFFSSEYERNPATYVAAPAALAPQTMTLPYNTTNHYYLGRVDYQIAAKDHLSVRANYWNWSTLTYAGDPSRGADRTHDSPAVTANWSRVIRNNLVQEVKFGYFAYHYTNIPRTPLTVEYDFPGYTFGSNWNYPSIGFQHTISGRYDLAWHTSSHDVKVGAELQIQKDGGHWEQKERGQMYFSKLPTDIATRFPLGSPASQWNFTGLDSTVTMFNVDYARNNNWDENIPHDKVAAWIADNWRVSKRLSFNLGLRYDVGWDDFIAPGVTATNLLINNGLFTENVGYNNNIRDLTDLAPRLGFIWRADESGHLVIHGGSGLYYSTPGGQQLVLVQLFNGQRVIASSFSNDGKPGFLSDPTRGITGNQVLSGQVPLPPQATNVFGWNDKYPRVWQSMLGFEKQVSDVIGVNADLIYEKGTHEGVERDPNVLYDSATGLFKNPVKFGRPAPAFGAINLMEMNGVSEYMALTSKVTRRFRNNFELGFTYTLMFFDRDDGIDAQGLGNQQLNPFNRGMDWARSADFQRNTVNINALWKLPAGFQLTGSFHYGSGNYTTMTSPVNPLGEGSLRVLADGSIIPRDTFKNDPWQNLSFRVSKDIRLFGDVKATGMAEVFNVYNYATFNRNTIVSNVNFGKATSAANQPLSGQLAFRISW